MNELRRSRSDNDIGFEMETSFADDLRRFDKISSVGIDRFSRADRIRRGEYREEQYRNAQ